jgi:hypothetical protein
MGVFYNYLKRRGNLYRAWQHVRSSAKNSSNEKTIDQLREFDDQLPSKIQGISGQLAIGKYKFSSADGVLKDKKKREKEGRSPRPVVVALLRDRIVQRTILDAL